MDSDTLLFPDSETCEDNERPDDQASLPWRILVVDDDEQMHRVTRLVLSRIKFEGRSLELISAYSAKEAKGILGSQPDIALALIDVVMETEHAGLHLVNWVRWNLGNRQIRLVLRTGQPGQAPENKVIEQYDINDYRDKTELTQVKMKTLLYSSLRAYRDIMDGHLPLRGV